MGDYGATVVKVEPLAGDYVRQLGSPFVDGDSAMFKMLNRNKSSIALDLDEAADREVLTELLATADVLVEDLSVRRREQLGLTFDELHALNPRLVHCTISQLGERGPWRDKAVTELELQALTSATHFLGRPGDAPVRIGADICSVGAGQNAYQGVLAALIARFRTGRGERVHVSQLQAALYTYGIMLAAFDDPDEWSGHHCSARGNETDYGYATADEPLQFGPAFQSDRPWIDLCRELDMEDLLEHPYFVNHQQRASNAALGKPILEERFRRYSREHLLKVINETGNIAVPLNDHMSVIEHEQVLANGRIVEMTLQSGEMLRAPGIPWDLSETPGSVTLPPPLLDEHRTDVLATIRHGKG
jgi:crotonobetainyl-CoA:carnitine CoA-transferase CaiB-like acyl-CoA transferase